MPDTKSPLQSLTVNSILIGLFVQVLALFGVQIAPEVAAQIGASINSIVVGVTMLVALYGRLRAKKAIAIGADPAQLRTPAVVAVLALFLALFLLLAGCSSQQGGRPASLGDTALVAGATIADATLLPPASTADATTLDEQAALSVELAYKAARTAAELGVDSGAIKGEAALRLLALDNRAYAAVRFARGAYLSGNAPTYQAAVARARGLVDDLLGLVGK